MILAGTGNLLDADVEALVNTVNTVGIMGKGVALQFKQAFPENFRRYHAACRRHEVRIGAMFVTENESLGNPRWIVNFPTKRHWRAKSRIEDIDAGLVDLRRVIRDLGIKSIAIPALGCGNGGLQWSVVRPRIESALTDLSEVSITIFDPTGAPAAREQRIATKRPNMTPGRAALVGILGRYLLEPGATASLLEIQKLLYLLQEGGENLDLNFAAGRYGPYAENVNFPLQRLEGHYLRGYGDRTGAGAAIELMPGAIEEAASFLEAYPETVVRFERVRDLIDGFESPYGLELLATTHWVGAEDPAAAEDVDIAIAQLQAWNERKKHLFQPAHVRKAWERLRAQGWLASQPVHA